MYEFLAKYYDQLMSDVDYDEWATRVAEWIRSKLPSARRGVDLACGSGNFTARLIDAGFDVIGSDASCEMLAVAAQKHPKIRFICQKAFETRLPAPVDFLTMMCDGLNYCTEDLRFDVLADQLKKNGVLIFDISGYEYVARTLGGNLYYEDTDEVTYFWQNEFDAESSLLTAQLTFFEPAADGRYRRYDEEQTMRAYRVEEVLDALKPYFNVETFFGDGCAADESRRIHFLCVKK